MMTLIVFKIIVFRKDYSVQSYLVLVSISAIVLLIKNIGFALLLNVTIACDLRVFF